MHLIGGTVLHAAETSRGVNFFLMLANCNLEFVPTEGVVCCHLHNRAGTTKLTRIAMYINEGSPPHGQMASGRSSYAAAAIL